MIEGGQYTGIIKTMPANWLKDVPGGVERWERSVFSMNGSDKFQWRFNLPGRPRFDVLHFYLLMGGIIRFRANIISYDEAEEIKCYDGSKHFGRCWVIIGPPVMRAPREIRMKGFQGFRYTEDLWQ
jgi:hypothetical protein